MSETKNGILHSSPTELWIDPLLFRVIFQADKKVFLVIMPVFSDYPTIFLSSISIMMVR